MRCCTLRVLFVAATVGAAAGARADFDELLGKLPGGGNVLVMINAEDVLASGLAKREGWRKAIDDDFATAPMMTPRGTQQFALAGQLELATFASAWEAAVVRMDEDVPISAVARFERGMVDEVGGLDAVASPKGLYIVKLDESLYGVVRPGNRQCTARWVREIKVRNEQGLSDYLAAAASYPDNAGTEMILAIDLTDALSRRAIREGVAASPAIKAGGVDVEEATETLAGLRGLTLGIKVADRAIGALRVDFASDASVLVPVAKPLLLEVLEGAGASVDEFYDWKVSTSDRGFRLTGQLDRSGLMRIFSFLKLETPDVVRADAQAAGDDSKGESAAVDPTISQQYFSRINDYLNDLKRERGAKSYYSVARWFETYAGRIDRLPLLGVDPELLDYSEKLVGQMRDCALAIRGAGIKTGGRAAQEYGSWSYPAFYGSYADPVAAGRAQASTRMAIRAQERANSSLDVRNIVSEMQEEASRMRREMTKKYGIEF